MTKKFLTIALAAAFSFSIQTVFAGDSKEKAVEKLMKVMKVKENIDKSLDNVMSMQEKAFQNKPQVIAEIKKFYKKNIGWEAQKADIINIYKELFSEKEINNLIAFYETPTGKKMVELEPKIQEKLMKMTMARMQKAMPELQKIIMEALQKPSSKAAK